MESTTNMEGNIFFNNVARFFENISKFQSDYKGYIKTGIKIKIWTVYTWKLIFESSP